MAQLSITESESIVVKVLSKTPKAGGTCQHVTITYEVDGVQKSFEAHETELATMGPRSDEELVRAFIRQRVSRGKSYIGLRIV
jgi:hypothetical protein